MSNEDTDIEKRFIRKIFIEEIGRLQTEGFYFFSFILMAQAIETMGAFADNKPMKAKGQAAKRFSKSLNLFLGKKYRFCNEDHWLFDKLRNQLTHSFVPSKSLFLTHQKAKTDDMQHLHIHEGRLVLVAEDLYADLVNGCNRMFSMIDQGKLKLKKMAISEDDISLL